jgi:hypothetical protein
MDCMLRGSVRGCSTVTCNLSIISEPFKKAMAGLALARNWTRGRRVPPLPSSLFRRSRREPLNPSATAPDGHRHAGERAPARKVGMVRAAPLALSCSGVQIWRRRLEPLPVWLTFRPFARPRVHPPPSRHLERWLLSSRHHARRHLTFKGPSSRSGFP